ncbi:MAG: alpha/beta hydrolase [Chloroflexi bacterium]|nr:alpha/beta hydrolase [Chloroflexota bacterium]
MTRLHVETHGTGRPVLFVHGAMGHGRDAWRMQLPLADRWRLLIADRAGFGESPGGPQDAEAQADDLAALIPGGADVVGHSYGGVIALLLAAQRPDLVRSLTVIEPPALGLVRGDPDVDAFVGRTRVVFENGPSWPEEQALRTFLLAFGLDPGEVRLSDLDRRDVAATIREPAPWTIPIPLETVAEVGVRTLVVTGGWPAGETIAAARSAQRALAAVARLIIERLRAEHAHFPTAHHDVQSRRQAFNERLLAFVEGG